MFLARHGAAALLHLLSLLNTNAVCVYMQTVSMSLHQVCAMINCYTYYHGPKLSFWSQSSTILRGLCAVGPDPWFKPKMLNCAALLFSLGNLCTSSLVIVAVYINVDPAVSTFHMHSPIQVSCSTCTLQY